MVIHFSFLCTYFFFQKGIFYPVDSLWVEGDSEIQIGFDDDFYKLMNPIR